MQAIKENLQVQMTLQSLVVRVILQPVLLMNNLTEMVRFTGTVSFNFGRFLSSSVQCGNKRDIASCVVKGQGNGMISFCIYYYLIDDRFVRMY